MPGDLRKGIVRILDSDGNTADTGFLVTADGLSVAVAHPSSGGIAHRPWRLA